MAKPGDDKDTCVMPQHTWHGAGDPHCAKPPLAGKPRQAGPVSRGHATLPATRLAPSAPCSWDPLPRGARPDLARPPWP